MVASFLGLLLLPGSICFGFIIQYSQVAKTYVPVSNHRLHFKLGLDESKCDFEIVEITKCNDFAAVTSITNLRILAFYPEVFEFRNILVVESFFNTSLYYLEIL